MYKILLEDISSDIEVIVFPNSAKNISDNYFQKGDILIVSGSINKESSEENSIVKVFYNSSEKIDSRSMSSGKALVFSVDKNISPTSISKIYDIIESTKGDKPVYLEVRDGKHKFVYKFNKSTSQKAQNAIQQILNME